LHMEPSVRPRRKPHKVWLIDEACRNAVDVLERERLTRYEESIRRLEFPQTAEASLTQDFCSGKQFSDSLIVSALLDAERAGYLVDWNSLNGDIARLLSSRSCIDVPGSKFFSSLPAMSSDIDELAQMIQVLRRVEYPELSQIVEPLLQAIEESSENEEGSFKTWTDGSYDESPISAPMTRSDHMALGTGPHPAVLANILYAAQICDPERCRERIGGAIRYLAACQDSDGSWPATWHAGSYYSTFACVRALLMIDPCHYACYRAARFLRETQDCAGGWGRNIPNSEDSAYALRTACAIDSEITRSLIPSGSDFLIRQQEANGFWTDSGVDCMNTSRTTNAQRDHRLFYPSRIVATSACLSALCAARPIANRE